MIPKVTFAKEIPLLDYFEPVNIASHLHTEND